MIDKKQVKRQFFREIIFVILDNDKIKKRTGYFLLPIVIFFISLGPKIFNIDSGFTIDELHWLFRSEIFVNAIWTGDYSNTFVTSHPGVILMWLTGLSLKFFSPDTESFFQLLTIARLPVIITTSICIVIIYYLLSDIFSFTLAFLSSLLISLDPFILSQSMIVQSDGLLALFVCISLLSFYIFFTKTSYFFLCISSLFSGLAILSKISGSIVIFIIIIMLLFLYFKKTNIRKFFLQLSLYLGGVIASVCIFWPVFLFSPLLTLKGLLFGEVTATSKSGVFQLITKNQNGGAFLFGLCPGLDCGLFYYPVNILMKISPLLISMVILVFYFLMKDKSTWVFSNTYKQFILYNFVIILSFFILLQLSPKRSERYALPLFPFLDILIVISLLLICSLLSGKTVTCNSGKVFCILVIFIALIQSFLILPVAPYYYSYFNPLFFGGPENAPNISLIGLGEGNDLAAEYLNTVPGLENSSVIAQHPTFTPYFLGQTWQLRKISDYSSNGTVSHYLKRLYAPNRSKTPKYIVFYTRYLQLGYDKSIYVLFNGIKPEKIIKINNIDYAYIYPISDETLNKIQKEQIF